MIRRHTEWLYLAPTPTNGRQRWPKNQKSWQLTTLGNWHHSRVIVEPSVLDGSARQSGNADCSVDRYKARLVALVCDAWASTLISHSRPQFTTVSTLSATVTLQNLYVHQMDVNSAFLNGTLDHEIHMSQGAYPGQEHLVCRLKRTIMLSSRPTPLVFRSPCGIAPFRANPLHSRDVTSHS
jgi:Reverse transcriptase (RNA-dependent DNA polymerase)